MRFYLGQQGLLPEGEWTDSRAAADVHDQSGAIAERHIAVRMIDPDSHFRFAARCAFASGGIDTLEFASVEQYLASMHDERFGCIVVEPQLFNRLRTLCAATGKYLLPVVVVATSATAQEAVDAFKAGVADFLFKPVDTAELFNAVMQVIEVSEQRRAAELRQQQMRESFGRLTRREREVLALMLEGHGNRHIATAVGSAERTIKAHRASMMRKLEVRSLTHLINAYRSVLSFE